MTLIYQIQISDFFFIILYPVNLVDPVYSPCLSFYINYKEDFVSEALLLLQPAFLQYNRFLLLYCIC